MTSREIAEPNTILRATVGSTLHGLALEGTDDMDEMGVCIEPPEYVVGLRQFEQWVYRTADEGQPSQPGDLDLTIYSLRKWSRLALKGNPTVLLLLFAPPDYCSVRTDLGEILQTLAPAFVSRSAGTAFLGYAQAQRERLTGERGQKRSKRPELEERHGYDTKYAMHMLRLGYQGVELLSTGRLVLPMHEAVRDQLRDVRLGIPTLDEILSLAGTIERDLRDLLTDSPLPLEPERDRVDSFLIGAYTQVWAKMAGE